MGSTKADDIAAVVNRFFLKEMMPLAKDLEKKGKVFFPLTFDPGAKTYYVKRKKTTVSPEDLELVACSSFDNFRQALSDMWTAQGYPEMAALAPALSKLARLLYSVEEQSEEVSPFIYVMF